MAKEAEIAARRARMEARAKEAAAPRVIPPTQAKNLVELAEHVEIKRKRKESLSQSNVLKAQLMSTRKKSTVVRDMLQTRPN